MAKLFVEEQGKRREIDLASYDQDIIVGREQSCDIFIEDSMSSRRHCRVVKTARGYEIEDLKSSNGTTLNGHTITCKLLENGDVFRIGEVKFEFLSEEKQMQQVTRPSSSPGLESVREAAVHHLAEVQPCLQVKSGPQSGERFEIDKSPFTIGRRKSNDLFLQDALCSGEHARIIQEGDSWFIEDLGSGNGTIVGRNRVMKHRLLDGQTVLLGETQICVTGLPEVPTQLATSSTDLDELPLSQASRSRSAATSVFLPEDTHRINIDHASPSSPFQVVFTLIFLMSFIGILFGGFTLIRGYLRDANPPIDASNLLMANPSFEELSESGQVLGWAVDPLGDGAVLSSVSQKGLHGRRAMAIQSLDNKLGFVRVYSESNIELEQQKQVEVSAKLRCSGGIFFGGLVLQWYSRRSGETKLVAESYSQLLKPRNTFSGIRSVLPVPVGVNADSCRVAIFGLGSGRLEVDKILVKWSDEEPSVLPKLSLASNIDRDRDLSLEFTADSSFSITRGRDLLVRSMRLTHLTEDRFPFGQLLSISAQVPITESNGAVSSSFALAVGKNTVAFDQWVQSSGQEMAISYRQVGEGEVQPALLIEMEPRLQRASVSVFSQGKLVLQDGQLESAIGEQVEELVFGSGAEQLIVTLSEPLTLNVLAKQRSRGIQTLILQAEGPLRDGVLDLYIATVSTREEMQLKSVRAEVQEFIAMDRPGLALQKLLETERALPYRSDFKVEANAWRKQIDLRAEERFIQLKAIYHDLNTTSSPPVLALFVQQSQQMLAAYKGHPISAKVEELVGEIGAVRSHQTTDAEEHRAFSALDLADSYFLSKRDNLARFYAKRVLGMVSEGELFRRAHQIIKLVEARN